MNHYGITTCITMVSNQQVLAPTRKSNILDLIFSTDDFINCIDITDSVISATPLIPISHSPPPCQTMNSTCNTN